MIQVNETQIHKIVSRATNLNLCIICGDLLITGQNRYSSPAKKYKTHCKTCGKAARPKHYRLKPYYCVECGDLLVKGVNRFSQNSKNYKTLCKNCYKKPTPLTKEEKRIRHNLWIRTYKTKIRLSVIQKLGAVCINCDFSDARALQIDHIKGGGLKERRKNGYLDRFKYYKMLDNLPLDELRQNYQILCANCNWIKRATNKEITTIKL